MSKKFCVYAHKDSEGQIRYIGKGKINRPWNFNPSCRSTDWLNVFGENKPIVEILKNDLEEQDAFDLEKETIEKYLALGMPLVNKCKGGYGGDSRAWDAKKRKEISIRRKGAGSYWFGKKRDPETVKKSEQTKTERGSHTRYWAGKKRDAELIEKLIASGATPEARAKQKETRSKLDLSWPEERKKKLSERMKGKDFGPDHGEKISRAKKGRPNGLLGTKKSEETIQKMSQAAMGRVYGQEVIDKTKATKLANGNTTKKAKQIECIETEQKFRCATDAADNMFDGKGFKGIQKVCSGAKKSYMGYTFRYVSKE